MKQTFLILCIIIIIIMSCRERKPVEVTVAEPDYSYFCDKQLPPNWHIVKFSDGKFGAFKEKEFGILDRWLMSKGSIVYDTNVSENWATHFKDTCELKANIPDMGDYKIIR
jgi:hypothetical protein